MNSSVKPSLSTLLQAAASAHQKDHKASPFGAADQRLVEKKKKEYKKWSDEQECFLSSSSDRSVLTALAGSGKTSVLLEFARRRPHQKWNFIAFNSSVAEQVAKQAPKNLRAQTAHQMAYARFGCDLHHKLVDDQNDVLRWIVNQHPSKSASWCKSLYQSIFGFIFSADPFPGCSSPICIVDGVSVSLDDVCDLWEMMISPEKSCPITHDVYLKRFAMADASWQGKFWMLDEAQDWNDAFLDSWDRNTPYSVRAGDPFQKMYEWRGSSSSSWVRPREKEFWLTQSFRTGQGAQDLVNAWLGKMDCAKKWLPAHHTTTVVDVEQSVQEFLKFSPTHVLSGRWSDLETFTTQMNAAGVCVHLNNTSVSAPPGVPIATTIHQMKGLESDRVWILDDALPSFMSPQEQSRLAYVAITRSIHALRVPRCLRILQKSKSVLSGKMDLF